jgi:hypothetical protein
MKLARVLPLVCAVSCANQALAQENQPSKFSAGINLGLAQHTVDVSGADANYDEESANSFAPDVFFSYKFNDNWSVVTQYTNYGEADLFDAQLTLDAPGGGGVPVDLTFSSETTGFSVVGQYMTARNVGHWSFGAKLGLMKWDTDFHVKATNTINQATGTVTESDSGVAVYGGLLGAYALNEKIDLTLGVDWFVNDLDVKLIEGAQTDMQYSKLSAGIAYNW